MNIVVTEPNDILMVNRKCESKSDYLSALLAYQVARHGGADCDTGRTCISIFLVSILLQRQHIHTAELVFSHL